MIHLLAKPVKAPVVNREGLYTVLMKVGNGDYKELLSVRARTGAHAEEKLAFCFEHELTGKTIDFNMENINEKIRHNDKAGPLAQTQQS